MARKRAGSLLQMFGAAAPNHLVEIPDDSAPVPRVIPAATLLSRPVALVPDPVDEDDVVGMPVSWWDEHVTPQVAPAPEAVPLIAKPSPPPIREVPKPAPVHAFVPALEALAAVQERGAGATPPTPVVVADDTLPVPDLATRPSERSRLLLRYLDEGESVEGMLFSEVSLPGARLRAAELQGVMLQQADLTGADLRGASLRGANLQGASLRGADLRGADLRDCVVDRAELEKANLRFADLRGTSFVTVGDMTGADLRGADLRGVDVTESMRGVRIDEQTYFRSDWSAIHLVAAKACGALLEGIDRLPPGVSQELAGAERGLALHFATELNFRDQYVLQGVICAILGQDACCSLQTLPSDTGCEVRIVADVHSDLTEIAEAISGRAWERMPESDRERALNRRLFEVFPNARLINDLSALVDRLDRLSLRGPDGEATWRPPVEPQAALQHLLLKLFIPVELRWWLTSEPGGKMIVRDIPARNATHEEVVKAAIRSLQRRQRIDATLFTSLIQERRRREADIRAVARVWGIEWYALRDQDEV